MENRCYSLLQYMPLDIQIRALRFENKIISSLDKKFSNKYFQGREKENEELKTELEKRRDGR